MTQIQRFAVSRVDYNDLKSPHEFIRSLQQPAACPAG